jgi:hypothetical protein
MTLFALAATARAQEAAPTATTAAPPASDAAAALTPPPAAATAAPSAADTAAAPAPVIASKAQEPAAGEKRFEVALSFLPMGVGKYSNSPNAVTTVTTDAAFAYGFGLSAGYEVIPHLVVGLAPQVIFNVKEKVPGVPTSAARQYDLMARVAYGLTVVEGTSVYAEVFPGYSVITTDATPSGFVVAFGLGAAMQMTDRIFVNVGGGYQIGFQKWSKGANTYTTSTKYLRVALGGGVRF